MNEENGEQQIGKRIKFTFRKSDDHISVLSNRVWGGPAPGDLFEMSFLLERQPLPRSVTQQFTEGRESEVERDQDDTMIRENLVTVRMSLNTLLSFQSWINSKVKELETRGAIIRQEEN